MDVFYRALIFPSYCPAYITHLIEALFCYFVYAQIRSFIRASAYKRCNSLLSIKKEFKKVYFLK